MFLSGTLDIGVDCRFYCFVCIFSNLHADRLNLLAIWVNSKLRGVAFVSLQWLCCKLNRWWSPDIWIRH